MASQACPRTPRTRIAIVDDDPAFAHLLQRHLAPDELEIEVFETLPAACAASNLASFELFIVDASPADGASRERLRMLSESERGRPVPTIVVTRAPSLPDADEALRLGIVDCIGKPVAPEQVRLAVLRTLSARRLQRQVASAHQLHTTADAFLEGLGDSQDTRALARRAGQSELPVFITGETGTGKTRLARWLHDTGPRRHGPFVAANCAALPATLVEAELFGVEQGAFTGAERARPGLFERANEGTLFLDEIAEMPRELQSKLLHALDSHAIRRVGGTQEISLDVRVIAATNLNPERAVQTGQLRRDLLFRLGVVQLRLLPLRHRAAQIPRLVERILQSLDPRLQLEDLGPGELQWLQAHAWPGNVRELRNVLERALMMRIDALQPSRFMVDAAAGGGQPAELPTEALQSLHDVEREHIYRVLGHFRGNRSRTAQVLEVAESTLRRKLKRYRATAKSGPLLDAIDGRTSRWVSDIRAPESEISCAAEPEISSSEQEPHRAEDERAESQPRAHHG